MHTGQFLHCLHFGGVNSEGSLSSSLLPIFLDRLLSVVRQLRDTKEAGSFRLDSLITLNVRRGHFGAVKWICPVNLGHDSHQLEALLGGAASVAVHVDPLWAAFVSSVSETCHCSPGPNNMVSFIYQTSRTGHPNKCNKNK